MAQLVGFKRFKSKNGKDICIATILREASAREKAFGTVGMVAEEIFLPAEQYDYLTEKMIGKNLKLYWDRAYLERVEVA